MVMQKRLSQVIALAFLLLSGSAWSQTVEQKIVIEPAYPDSNDLITISITNSACYALSEVRQELDRQFVEILLTFFATACRDADLNAPNFETTIGPSPVGDYSVLYRQLLNGSVTSHRISTLPSRPI